MYPEPTTIKRTIKRFAPLQLGKILAVLYGIMGLIFLPFMLLMSLLGPRPEGQGAGMLAFGVGFGLFLPIFYAVMGFITGVIGAFVYNLVAKWVGGIEVEVE